MKVSSGTLTIGEGSQLAAYGGGNIATTSVGGAAVILDNGTISGAGTLIAVAGRGDGDNGGNAVEGTGNVETAKAYLEGGSAYSFMNKNAEPGKAYTESVTISPSTKGTAVNGKKITSNSESAPDTYWSDITKTPDDKIQNCTISDITIIQTVNPSPSVNPSVTPAPTVTPIPDTYPEGTEKDKNGNLCGLVTVKLESKKDEKTGRMMMAEVPGSEQKMDADLVLIAAGFLGTENYIANAFGVDLNARTNVATAEGAYATNVKNVFTAGDMHRGQSLVVWAIREGREAAREVDESLMGYSNLVIQ